MRCGIFFSSSRLGRVEWGQERARLCHNKSDENSCNWNQFSRFIDDSRQYSLQITVSCALMQAAHISRLSTFYRFLHWISSDGTRAARKIQRSQIDCWNKLEKIESHQSNRAAPTVDVFMQSAIEMQFVFPEAYHTTLPWQERLEGQLNFPTSSLFLLLVEQNYFPIQLSKRGARRENEVVA